MGPDRASGCRVGDHQVVAAPARDKVELREEVPAFGPEPLDVADQQRPGAIGQGSEAIFFERAVFDRPVGLVGPAEHEPGAGIRVTGEPGQIVGLDGVGEARYRAAYEQRLLLPVVAQKLRR